VRYLLFCVSFWSLAAFAQTVPTSAKFLDDPLVRAYFVDILRQGGFGHWKTERAAFIVRDDNSHYRCVAWPSDGRLYRQEFHGRIPPGTVAIVHTHPSELPDASVGDRATAVRMSLPIFVLTPLNINVITIEGASIPIFRNRQWAAVGVPSTQRCSADVK
jgi:hypothetical protein